MRENGLKVKDFVSLFHLEVLNQGSDFDTALLTVPDLNRPGLQFHSLPSPGYRKGGGYLSAGTQRGPAPQML